MGEIKHLSDHNRSSDRSLKRIVAAARADAGLWLMIKEREMELHAMRAELQRQDAAASEIDRLFPDRLKPLLSELADDLVSRLFGSCGPDVLARIQDALLDAAKRELDAG